MEGIDLLFLGDLYEFDISPYLWQVFLLFATIGAFFGGIYIMIRAGHYITFIIGAILSISSILYAFLTWG